MQGLITAVNSEGLNLQVLGYFDGTIEQLHLDRDAKSYKLGKKVKARVLYGHSTSPPKLALSLADHIVKLAPRIPSSEESGGKTLQELYPVGTKLDSVKVIRLEPERGLIVEIEAGVEGFIHVCDFLYLLQFLAKYACRRFHMYLMTTFHRCWLQGHGKSALYTPLE